MERTRLKYVHINSNHRYLQGIDSFNGLSQFKVWLGGHPIQNVKRVAVKQFSMANTLYNVREDNQILEWWELYYEQSLSTPTRACKRHVVITLGTYTTATLVEKTTTEIAANRSGFLFTETDTPLTITLSLSDVSDNYTVNVNVKWVKPEGEDMMTKPFALSDSYYGIKDNLLDALGFTKEQQVGSGSGGFWNAYDANEPFQFDQDPETSTLTAEEFDQIYAILPIDIQGYHPSTFESTAGVYLASETLTNGNTYETTVNQNTGMCHAVPRMC